MERLRLAGAQVNTVVGDLDDNVELIGASYRQAVETGAHLVVFPELAVTGYPPEDLVFKPAFLDASLAGVREVARRTGETAAPAAAAGAEVVVSLNASPYRLGKHERLGPMLATRAADHGVHIFWVNQLGGQDELVFEGQSRHIDPLGRTLARAAAFEPELLVVDLHLDEGATAPLSDRPRRSPVAIGPLDGRPAPEVHRVTVAGTLPAPATPAPPRLCRPLDRAEEVYQALVTATRDYVDKNGFREVVLGLSGGIDSSLVAVIAADALGRERVTGVAMPSGHSSEGSLGDARALADNLGIRL